MRARLKPRFTPTEEVLLFSGIPPAPEHDDIAHVTWKTYDTMQIAYISYN